MSSAKSRVTAVAFPAMSLLVTAAKELKRLGRLSVFQGQVYVVVPYLQESADGGLVQVNKLSSIWRPR